MVHASSQKSARYLLAVDGGGSTTRALIGNETGMAWGYGEAAGCNAQQCDTLTAAAIIEHAVLRAWENLGLPSQPFASAFLGIAGAGSLAETERVQLGSKIAIAAEGVCEVDHDVRIALVGGLSGRAGVAVIAGTGSSGYGRANDGRRARAGGWGTLLDDAGSGYWLGLECLKAVTRMDDGRAPATTLRGVVAKALQADDLSSLLPNLRSSKLGRPEIAALAPEVLRCAREDDPEASRIVSAGAHELALIATAVGAKLFSDSAFDTVLLGGLSQDNHYWAAVSRALQGLCPRARLCPAEHPPVTGALLIAARNIGFEPTAEWLAAADRSLRHR